MKNADVSRFQLNLSERDMACLSRIQKEVGATSKVETIRKTIKICSDLIEFDLYSTVDIVDPDGNVVFHGPLHLLW